jgi:hypothetical protein
MALAPNRDTDCIQVSVSTFVYAVIALARIGAPLPQELKEGDAATRAWRCGGEILHILHRRDITRDQYLLLSGDRWQRLIELDGMDVPMRIINDSWQQSNEPPSMLRDWSSQQLLQLARATLFRNRELVSLFREELRLSVKNAFWIADNSFGKLTLTIRRWLRRLLKDPVRGVRAIKARAPVSLFNKIDNLERLRSQHIEFALSIIDSYSDKSDSELTGFLQEHPVHGANAIKAARSIESR